MSHAEVPIQTRNVNGIHAVVNVPGSPYVFCPLARYRVFGAREIAIASFWVHRLELKGHHICQFIEALPPDKNASIFRR